MNKNKNGDQETLNKERILEQKTKVFPADSGARQATRKKTTNFIIIVIIVIKVAF